MKVLLLYDYPPSPAGLATQGDLLYRGLLEMGIDAQAVHFESAQEKEWYYRWFEPNIVVGVGYWGHTPQLVLHPQPRTQHPAGLSDIRRAGGNLRRRRHLPDRLRL